jgi:hypothetical protein
MTEAPVDVRAAPAAMSVRGAIFLVPNVLPGELITAETRDFLRRTAAAPFGHIRGAVEPDLRICACWSPPSDEQHRCESARSA